MHGEDESLRAGTGGTDLLQDFETAQARQMKIENQDVGLQFLNGRRGGKAIASLARHLVGAFGLKQAANPTPHNLVVIGDDD